MRGRKIIRSVTQTPASTRMSHWIKYGCNKSHISAGRYTWIRFQHEEVLPPVTWTHWTQRTGLFWFPVGSSVVRPWSARRTPRTRTGTDIGELCRLLAVLPTFSRQSSGKKPSNPPACETPRTGRGPICSAKHRRPHIDRHFSMGTYTGVAAGGFVWVGPAADLSNG